MDIREYVRDEEEVLRTAFAGMMRNLWTSMPVQVSQDTQDGHTAVVTPTVKRTVTDQLTGAVTYEDHPLHPDVPIHFAGGGGVTATHPIVQGDEGIVVYAARAFDAWHQSGGNQQPIDERSHSLSDAMHIPGVRSDPRKLQQVSNASHQVRSDDKLHVIDHNPTSGTTIKSADASTPPASASFDPFSAATKFISHAVQAATGILGSAVDGGTTHSHGVTHSGGPFMTALNALHSVLCDPSNGPSMNARNMLHKVLAHPTIGAALMGSGGASSVIAKDTVALQSATGISLSCPPGGLSLPSGGVGASSMAAGAAASNVGTLGGDLAGTLPNPQVVGLGHVDAHLLPVAASDAEAAAAGVPVGGLYRNVSFVVAGTLSGTTLAPSGMSVLCVRMS